MAAREENILNVPISETLEGMHVLCDTGDTGEPYRVAASLFIAEATQAAKDAVSNLDPKDVILKGFTALTAGKPAITANTTLLAAIQSLYAMVGSGKVKIVSDGADQTGMVSWNGTSASGFVINVNEAAIYTRSQWTQASPDSVTDANWIAAVKTGGTKTPFAAAAQNPNMGDLPTGSSNEIFPGWKLIVSSWSSAVGPSGKTGIIYFNQEIPTTSKILIEATIQSSPATTAAIKLPVPLTIAGINGTGQGVLFEICSMYLGMNSTPGSIKLICSSVITGANGVRGMNVVVQSNNLSDISDIIQIKGIYFKA